MIWFGSIGIYRWFWITWLVLGSPPRSVCYTFVDLYAPFYNASTLRLAKMTLFCVGLLRSIWSAYKPLVVLHILDLAEDPNPRTKDPVCTVGQVPQRPCRLVVKS